MALRSPDVRLIQENGRLAGLVTTCEEAMDEITGFIGRESVHLPDFSFQRNTVYMRFCHRDYHKGAALGALCRNLSIPHAEVFSAGDHFNDLSMLDGTFAAFPCCPSNAIPEVKSAVQTAGGYVASLPAADGVAEAWRFFTDRP